MQQYLADESDMRTWRPGAHRQTPVPKHRPRQPGRAHYFRPRVEPLEDRLLLATFLVTNTDDSGPGSLRQAILDSNSNPGPNTIGFNIGEGGVQTIAPTSALPGIIDPVVIDGTSQPGYAGAPLIELTGNLAGGGTGLRIFAGNSTVTGLVINRWLVGIVLQTKGGNAIAGNYIGTDVSGTVALRNFDDGVQILGGSGNTIGGTTAGSRNLISGNGTDGIRVRTSGNLVQGNYIGTDVTGTRALANEFHGVLLSSANNNTIGGATTGAGNLISGNASNGVAMWEGSSSNLVQGNYIGTDVTGTMALPNRNDGVGLWDAFNNTIGGTVAGAGNVCSGNQRYGFYILGSGSSGNLLQGNYIGTDFTGTGPLGNGWSGVTVAAENNTIGGAEAGAGNVIAFNSEDGVHVFADTGNGIRGNSIFANTRLGIRLSAGGNNNQAPPLLAGAINENGLTIVYGVLFSPPSVPISLPFFLDFYANSVCPGGVGQGEIYLGSGTVWTDPLVGYVYFGFGFAPAVAPGWFITATATGPWGTSQFSNCVLVQGPGGGGSPAPGGPTAAVESVALWGVAAPSRGTVAAGLPVLAPPVAPGSPPSSSDRLAADRVPGPGAAELFFGSLRTIVPKLQFGNEALLLLAGPRDEGLPEDPGWDFRPDWFQDAAGVAAFERIYRDPNVPFSTSKIALLGAT